jgi:hypothetical protein
MLTCREKVGGSQRIPLLTKRKDNMTTHELLKILDNTFPDVEFDIFTDTEGLVRVNFVVDDEPEDE